MIGGIAIELAASSVIGLVQSARADQLQSLLIDQVATILASFADATLEGFDLSGGGDGETFTAELCVNVLGGLGPSLAVVTFAFAECNNMGAPAAVAANSCVTALRAATAPADPVAIYMGVAQAGSAGKVCFAMVGTPQPN